MTAMNVRSYCTCEWPSLMLIDQCRHHQALTVCNLSWVIDAPMVIYLYGKEGMQRCAPVGSVGSALTGIAVEDDACVDDLLPMAVRSTRQRKGNRHNVK